MKCVNSSGVVMWSLVIWPFLWGIMQNCELFSKLTLHTPGGDMMRKSMIQMLTSTSCSNTGPPRLVQTLTSTSCSNTDLHVLFKHSKFLVCIALPLSCDLNWKTWLVEGHMTRNPHVYHCASHIFCLCLHCFFSVKRYLHGHRSFMHPIF